MHIHGSFHEVRIADFGCAIQFQGENRETGLVRDTVGTPAFWPPESIRNSNSIEESKPSWPGVIDSISLDPIGDSELESLTSPISYSAYQADLWAVSVTLHSLLYCVHPFLPVTGNEESEGDVLELFRRICEEQPNGKTVHSAMPMAQNEGPSAGVEAQLVVLCQTMLNKVPEERLALDEIMALDWMRNALQERASIRASPGLFDDGRHPPFT